MYDTGSFLNLIDEEWLNGISVDIKLRTSTFTSVVAVNGGQFPIKGVFDAPLLLDGHTYMTPLHVVSLPNNFIILGREFMNRYAEEFNWVRKTLSLRGCERSEVNMTNTHVSLNSQQPFAKVVRKTVLRPHEMTSVRIYPTTNVLTETLCFQSNSYLESLGLRALPQRVSGLTYFVEISVTNESSVVKVLYPNRKIGVLAIPINTSTCVVTAAETCPTDENETSNSTPTPGEELSPVEHNISNVTFLQRVTTNYRSRRVCNLK